MFAKIQCEHYMYVQNARRDFVTGNVRMQGEAWHGRGECKEGCIVVSGCLFSAST